MKRITTKKLLYFLTLCILILVPLIQNFSFFLKEIGYLSEHKFFNPFFVVLIITPFLMCLYIINIIKSKLKLDIYDYLFYLFIIIGIVVSLHSIDIYTSFFGTTTRYGGFISLLCYNLLFINWKKIGDKKDLENWYKIIIYIAIFNVIYSLLQVYSEYNFIVRTGAEMTASGLCGHNNFFGSLIVTTLSMLCCKFLCDKKYNFMDISTIVLLFIGLINCQSTGPFLAYIITFVFLIIFLKLKKIFILKKIIVLVIISILIPIAVTKINQVVFNINNCELCDIKTNSIDNGGNDRLNIWSRTLSVVKKYPILGVGYDNLKYVYPQHYPNIKVEVDGIKITNLSNEKVYYIIDNAHNIYLQTLVSSGIIGLIPYLILCLLTFINGCKSNKKIVYIVLAGFVAYSTQAFFNIDVITVVPIYYLIIGLILSNNELNTNTEIIKI